MPQVPLKRIDVLQHVIALEISSPHFILKARYLKRSYGDSLLRFGQNRNFIEIHPLEMGGEGRIERGASRLLTINFARFSLLFFVYGRINFPFPGGDQFEFEMTG